LFNNINNYIKELIIMILILNINTMKNSNSKGIFYPI
jgi:hypothetical protein